MESTRRREIEDVASSLFREHGYSGTSVRDIARALDIQGASLYAHVSSKQDVLWSIVERVATRFETAADAALAGAGGAGSEPRERLAALIRAHVGVITDDIERAGVFVHEWRSLTGERWAQIASRRDAYEERFRTVIADGVSAGRFATPDGAIAATFMLSALNAIAAWYRPDGRVPPRAMADAYVELMLRAVHATGDPGEIPR